MAMNRLDLNLLHVFETIYREGSLTRAARALHLTQPAVSHSLARLRAHFDDPLFIRQGNEMVATPLARRFADTMRPGLTQIQSAVNQFHSFDPVSQHKVFALGLRDILESTFLPHLMQSLDQYPEIEVVSQRIPRRDMETHLAAGKLDFAVDVLLPVSSQTSHELLRRDTLVVVAGPKFDGIENGLSLETYLAARHVLVSSRTEGPGIEDFELSRLGVHRRIALRCQHYYAACRVAEATDLLVTMPETYARMIIQQTSLRVLPLPTNMPPLNVHLYWHTPYEKEPALKWFRELLHQVAAH
ncbi:LysR family transcriptional regulator [Marinobacter sp. BGYM27]|uniref:LysR family transcriptional regulator n=1 Tax=unclassified Marinobacter TaxID=83889 RepID=UPI0021A843AD|nr:LysR family transcriptional regulator [Marinobacter sp. BGYM27]MDG5498320.1 LysR family transcriptional regulator [Marinobacter sp. BGYM27]